MRDGTFQEKNIYRVCDIIICGLTVWGEHCLDSEQWYSVSNISVRQYTNKTYFTTTKDRVHNHSISKLHNLCSNHILNHSKL